MSIITDATLSRQLSRLKLNEGKAPTTEEWQKLLKYLNAHYKHVDDDRDMMARSLEVSTEEMSRIRETIAVERDELRRTMELFQSALDDFAGACRATRNSGGEDTTAITGARKRFNMSMISLLDSSRESSVEYRELLNGLRNSFVNVFEEVMTMVSPDAALTDEIISLHTSLIGNQFDADEEGLHVAVRCDQLNGIGGDLWALRRLPSGQTLVCIGDATGHGSTAGFLTAAVAAALDAWLETQHVVDLEKLFRYLNGFVAQVGGGTMFMTWCGLIIERDRRSAAVINAGHVFPIILRNGNAQAMVLQGNPLGTLGDHPIKVGRLQLQAGDKVILFTDGITEVQNESQQEYGERRLRKLLEQYGQLVPAELVRQVIGDVDAYRANSSMSDDATVLVADIR
jgi:phosphoserine phosphatase RsbU/P